MKKTLLIALISVGMVSLSYANEIDSNKKIGFGFSICPELLSNFEYPFAAVPALKYDAYLLLNQKYALGMGGSSIDFSGISVRYSGLYLGYFSILLQPKLTVCTSMIIGGGTYNDKASPRPTVPNYDDSEYNYHFTVIEPRITAWLDFTKLMKIGGFIGYSAIFRDYNNKVARMEYSDLPYWGLQIKFGIS